MKALIISFVALVFCAVFAIFFFRTGCALNLTEFGNQEEKIKPMVQRHASKEDVIAVLGTNFVLYSKGQTNWENLDSYLRREPPTAHVALRERAAKWPHVLFYTTPDMMTRVFLDKDEKIVDFVVGAQ